MLWPTLTSVLCVRRVPDDVWLVDRDSGKLTCPSTASFEDVPPLPEPEGKTLRNHLKQVELTNKK